ncbi:aminopeptidase I zinc metalloprotease-domain-containing protein [Boeremia exigua]|uniref:aminopeptidase I zinc metalloprotease-domain-containing protein n=1 Tax=Boeremia exigua TaxID=749465 RepID=UPI001E8D9BC9|nr:aminopeptidase I zinc metalloprotease-domain-containing protein [Boeremia exigua]KAH6638737.1 aminopeptidase I zinc metalloprotease-domain-containing protein [Boeremia exigua]
MTKNHPSLRKAASNADLYAAPSPPQQLRHASSTLARSHTTAGSLPRRSLADWEQKRLPSDGGRARHSYASPYPNLVEHDDEFRPNRQRQSPPPVPPKIPEDPPAPYRLPAPKPASSHPWLPAQLPPAPVREKARAEQYTKPFTDFMTANPTVFHAVDAVAQDLEKDGYKKLSERDAWDLKAGGKYYVDRNGTSLIAFAIGDKYEAGNGAAIVAGHIDALTAKLKPIPKLRNKAGYLQLGVAPYAGALSDTWWDRDLGIGGRVLVKEHGKIVTKLVKLDWPIARIPTLAPHFGAAANGPFNKETQMVPIIGLDNSDLGAASTDEPEWKASTLGGEGAFAATQPEKLVKAISSELGITDYSTIVNWELELFDVQPATTGGLEREFIFAGRIDDKLCSWAAIQALLNASASLSTSSQLRIVALFDDEEVGSLLRQGARGNFLPIVMERIVEDFAASRVKNTLARTYANSFLVSSDVIHAVNPNFLGAYLENHAPRLNVGPAVSADSNAHMTTDAVSTAILQRCVDADVGSRAQDPKLQVFQIRNDSRSGGTVGPMLSAATGIRAIDCGIPQLSMHSIRATTGSRDPGLGVFVFQSFLERFEEVDREFR